MNVLFFKRYRGPGAEVDLATRQSYCVPRPGEFVCLESDDASVCVDRVEYILTPQETEVWVWVV